MSFRKADQLMELAAMVAAYRFGVTLKEIAARFSCSHRTAQRMTSALEAAFSDVRSKIGDDGQKRWAMDGGHFRELMSLAPEELAALDLAIGQISRGGPTVESAALIRLKEKMLGLVPRTAKARIETDHEALLEAQGFIARPGPKPKADGKVIAAIAEAIKACRVLLMEYRSQSEKQARLRRVAPYGLLYGARTYLVGRAAEDVEGPIRTYRLDAINKAHVGKEGYVRPEGFDLQAFANRAFGVYQSDREYGEICWRFAPEAAENARSYLFHPDQVVESEPDGSLTVRFSASGYLEMCWHLYSWGDKVQVVSPEPLRRMIQDHRRSDFPGMP